MLLPSDSIDDDSLSSRMPEEDDDDAKPSQARRISFPPEAIFQSVLQDGDNNELWTLLNTLDQTGLDIDAHGHTGITPLHQCVLNNNLDGVKMLLNFGADLNLADMYGLTPLHSASACGFIQVATLLVVYGANLFAANNDGDLPVDFSKNTEMANVLQSEMIVHIHSQEYVKSYILYKVKQWSLFLLQHCVIYIGKFLDYSIEYLKALWERHTKAVENASHSKTD